MLLVIVMNFILIKKRLIGRSTVSRSVIDITIARSTVAISSREHSISVMIVAPNTIIVIRINWLSQNWLVWILCGLNSISRVGWLVPVIRLCRSWLSGRRRRFWHITIFIQENYSVFVIGYIFTMDIFTFSERSILIELCWIFNFMDYYLPRREKLITLWKSTKFSLSL